MFGFFRGNYCARICPKQRGFCGIHNVINVGRGFMIAPMRCDIRHVDVKYNLVGGLVAILYFPIFVGNVIIPIDEVIFFRGVAQPPTSYCAWNMKNLKTS